MAKQWNSMSQGARIVGGVDALIIVCGCCSLAVAAATSSSRNTPTTAASSTATHTGPTATARPPTATPKPKTWTTVKKFSGNGISKTAPFTVTASQWKITWSCNPAAYGSEYNLIADLTVPGDQFGESVVNVICKQGDASTTSGE